MYLDEDDALEEQYFEWLDKTCKCSSQDIECTCICFSEWLEEKELYRQECNCDF